MKLHLLPSITLLPPPHDTADEVCIIQDWARGLDWVRWLLGSVRARTDVLMVEGRDLPVPVAWEEFAEGLLCETVGPALQAAWQAAHAGDLTALIAADEALSAQLPPELRQRSSKAGAVLLKSTRHARYQGVLGRLREAVGRGQCAGHLAVIWATVGHFFQLSLANVIAEYLHLEWDIALRRGEGQGQPGSKHSMVALTRRLMHAVPAETALRVVDA
ncbi:MAG: urease accessory UreF family protein [Verrucomicrobiaceae bacterium]